MVGESALEWMDISVRRRGRSQFDSAVHRNSQMGEAFGQKGTKPACTRASPTTTSPRL